MRITKSLTRALARHALVTAVTHNLQLRRAPRVQIHHAARGGAVSGTGSALRLHRHREVVAVDEADVEEVEPAGAVEGELCERGGRGGSAAGAFHGGGAAVAGDAGEFSGGGVLGAEGAAPEAAGPGGGDGDGAGLAGMEGEAGGGERRGPGAGQNAWPNCVAALVHYCECR